MTVYLPIDDGRGRVVMGGLARELLDLSVADLKRDWAQFQQEDPDNHAASFRIEFFEILMATINGRNDLEIIGLTPRETSNIILRLRAQL